MFLSMVKEIWETIQQTYSKKNDLAQVYKIKVNLMAAKQGNLSVDRSPSIQICCKTYVRRWITIDPSQWKIKLMQLLRGSL